MAKDLSIYTFRVIIEPDESSGYHGFIPLLKGVKEFIPTQRPLKKLEIILKK